MLSIYLNKNRPLRLKPSAKFNPKSLEPRVPVLNFQDGGALNPRDLNDGKHDVCFSQTTINLIHSLV